MMEGVFLGPSERDFRSFQRSGPRQPDQQIQPLSYCKIILTPSSFEKGASLLLPLPLQDA